MPEDLCSTKVPISTGQKAYTATEADNLAFQIIDRKQAYVMAVHTSYCGDEAITSVCQLDGSTVIRSQCLDIPSARACLLEKGLYYRKQGHLGKVSCLFQLKTEERTHHLGEILYRVRLDRFKPSPRVA